MKSSKILIIVGVILVVGLVAGGIYLVQRDSGDEAANTANNNAPSAGDSAEENTTMLAGTKLDDFTPLADVTELQIIDLIKGDGQAVAPGDTITAHYTGALAADGTIFQSSLDMGEPIQFSLDGVIAGWTQGVPGMKIGGTRRLIIPAELAYGQNPPPGSGIPSGAALVFDIELVSIP